MVWTRIELLYIFLTLTSTRLVYSFYYEWPLSAIIPDSSSSQTQSSERLEALRKVLSDHKIDAYVIPTADAHNSEYISPADARREWISGFTGSAGTAVVTHLDALLWTDSRYYTQFDLEVNATIWTLMKGSDLSLSSWLKQNLNSSSIVGVDPTTFTRRAWTALEYDLNEANIILVATPENLVDKARVTLEDPAPARPNNLLLALGLNYTGKPAGMKINQLVTQMSARSASAMALTALDDIAYTLNLRGSDIPYNPVFFSYLIIRNDVNDTADIILFRGDGSLPEDILQHLEGEGVKIQTRNYEDVFEYLRNMTTELLENSTIWLPQEASHAIYLAAEANKNVKIISTVSPVALMKCIKNDVELQGFRSAHIKDGIAVVRAMRWLHDQISRGVNVTEIDVSDKLEKLRREEKDAMGPSFNSIVGAGENGAIIHYSPPRNGVQRVITSNDMLLVDSGGQYKDGTTDITRTRHMSNSPTPAQRETFTRVLKGQILLGSAVFPRGSTGNVLETLARKSLWDVGLNYAHGTGHGVGHFLNVHEGPSGIGSALIPTDPGIVPGMIFSNEPGYYEVGEYGIRHEDLVEVIKMDANSDHIMAKHQLGDFDGMGAVAFRTLTMVPHQVACLNISMLSEFEIEYINRYHSKVFSTLGPILLERNLSEDYAWLQEECAPITNCAINLKLLPIMAITCFVNFIVKIY